VTGRVGTDLVEKTHRRTIFVPGSVPICIPQCSRAPSPTRRNGRYRSKSTAGPPDAGRNECLGRTGQISLYVLCEELFGTVFPTTG